MQSTTTEKPLTFGEMVRRMDREDARKMPTLFGIEPYAEASAWSTFTLYFDAEHGGDMQSA